jgi:hypothetical protein
MTQGLLWRDIYTLVKVACNGSKYTSHQAIEMYAISSIGVNIIQKTYHRFQMWYFFHA